MRAVTILLVGLAIGCGLVYGWFVWSTARDAEQHRAEMAALEQARESLQTRLQDALVEREQVHQRVVDATAAASQAQAAATLRESQLRETIADLTSAVERAKTEYRCEVAELPTLDDETLAGRSRELLASVSGSLFEPSDLFPVAPGLFQASRRWVESSTALALEIPVLRGEVTSQNFILAGMEETLAACKNSVAALDTVVEQQRAECAACDRALAASQGLSANAEQRIAAQESEMKRLRRTLVLRRVEQVALVGGAFTAGYAVGRAR